MSDDRFKVTVNAALQRLDRLSQRAGDLPPSHRVLVEEVLAACTTSVEELRAVAVELQQGQAQNEQALQELVTNLDRERGLHAELSHDVAGECSPASGTAASRVEAGHLRVGVCLCSRRRSGDADSV